MGTFNSLTWLLLPYGIWVKLVNASKVPRYAFYMLAKAMIALFGFPAPPGIVPYQLGPGMLVMEGLLLPGSCLVSHAVLPYTYEGAYAKRMQTASRYFAAPALRVRYRVRSPPASTRVHTRHVSHTGTHANPNLWA